MGFGTLFFGYFLILNITYYQFTDIIAALVMLLGLYKLSGVTRHFRLPMYAAIVFSVIALGELGFGIYTLFETYDPSELSLLISIIGAVRAIALAMLTVLMLRGMHDIARELEVGKVPLKCRTMIVWTLIVYGLYIISETNALIGILPEIVATVLIAGVLIGLVLVPIINLTIIHSCYVYICMPEDLEPKEQNPSRFAFVNEYRRRRDERRREEAEEEARRREEKRKKKGGK